MIYHRPHLYLTKPKSSDGGEGDTYHLHVSIALQDGETISVSDQTVEPGLKVYELEIVSGSSQTQWVWSDMFSFPDPNHKGEVIVNVSHLEDGFFVVKGTGKTLHSNADDKPFSDTK